MAILTPCLWRAAPQERESATHKAPWDYTGTRTLAVLTYPISRGECAGEAAERMAVGEPVAGIAREER